MVAALVVVLFGLSTPAANASTLASRETESQAGDDYYLQILHDRFGVFSDDGSLKELLATPDWGPQIRVWVDLSIYGDTVLEPTRVGEQAQAAIVSHLLSSLGVRDFGVGDLEDGFLSILDFTSNYSQLTALDAIAINPLSVDGPLATFNYAYGIHDLVELSNKIHSAVSFASSITGFLDDVEKYAKWGIEAITDRPWRELLIQYRDIRSPAGGGAGKSIAQTQNDLLHNPDYAGYYADLIEMMTRYLGDGSPFAGLFPLNSRFQTESDMWGALESGYQALLYSQDVETQSATGALIDLLVYQQAQTRVVAVQTASGAITVINTGPATLTSLHLFADGSEFASASTIAPYGRAVISDVRGGSLAHSGSIVFRSNGMPPTTKTFDEIRRRFYVPSLTVSGTGQTRTFSAPGFVAEAAGDLNSRWDFGDGGFTFGPSATHTFACPGAYTAQFIVTGSGGQLLAAQKPVNLGNGTPFDWTVSGNGYSVEPGDTAHFSISGPPNDGTTTVHWSFGDGGEGVGRTVDHVFGASTVRSVTAWVVDNESGCSLASARKWISVGTSSGWVQLPSDVTGDLMLSAAVGGYWASSPVTIAKGASLTIPGGVEIRSAAATLFDVSGSLQLTGTHLTSLSETGPPGVGTVAPTFRFVAVNAKAGSTVVLNNVTADKTSTLVQATKAASIEVTGTTVNDAYSAIAAETFDHLTVRNSWFNGGGIGVALTGSGEAELSGNHFVGSSIGFTAYGYTVVNSVGNHFDSVGAAAQLSLRGIKSTFTGSTVTGRGGLIGLWGSLAAGTTRLNADLPYQPSSVTVPAGTNLQIEPGARFKLSGSTYYPTVGFSVAGRIAVRGSAEKPVVFTSFADDTVGGDSDGADASGQPSSWVFLPFAIRGAGRVDVDRAKVLGGSEFVAAVPGDAWAGGWGTSAGSGGSITVTNSDLHGNASLLSGVWNSGGGVASIRVVNTTFSDGATISVQGGDRTADIAVVDSDLRNSGVSATAAGRAAITGTKVATISLAGVPDVVIADNVFYGGRVISLGNDSIAAKISGNSSADSVMPVASLWGTAPAGVTHLTADMPYAPSNVRVYPGSTLVFDPGVQVKMSGSTYYPTVGFTVDGTVRVEGTAAKPVVFTSLADDTVGGDTDGTDSAAVASSWVFTPFGLSGAGQFYVEHARVLGGQHFIPAVPGTTWGGGWGTGAGNGGVIEIADSEIAGVSPVLSGATNTESALAAIRITNTTFMQGSAVTIQGGGSSTVVEITDSDLGDSGVSIGSAARVSITGSRIPSIVLQSVPDAAITGNVLTGGEYIYLTGSAIDATISGNTSADGIPGVVSIYGTPAAGVTHLTADLPYSPSNVTVPPGSTLVLDPGVRVKVPGSGGYYPTIGFAVSGTVKVEGSAADPVVFTSAADDSIGGDSDGVDASATPSSWLFVPFGLTGAGVIDVDHARVLGGTNFIAAVSGSSWGAWTTNPTSGGVIRVTHSDIAGPTPVLVGGAGPVDLASVTLSDNLLRDGSPNIIGSASTVVSFGDNDLRNSGLSVGGAGHVSVVDNRIAAVDIRLTPQVEITGNTFYGSEYINLSDNSMRATVAGNSFADGTPGLVRIGGTFSGSGHLSADLPYLASNVQVNSGATLVFDPGVRVKIPGSTYFPTTGFSVGGIVRVQGTAAAPVVFTSFADDTVGGDTDGADAESAWSSWVFTPFAMAGAGQLEVDHAVSRGGSYFAAAVSGGGWGSWTTGVGTGGSIDIAESDVTATQALLIGASGGSPSSLASVRLADSTVRGGGVELRSSGATELAVERNRFVGSGVAVYVDGLPSTTTIRGNDFSGATVGVSSTVPLTAKANWWGSPAGPSGGHSAGALVETSPWCIDPLCAQLSASSPTGISVDGVAHLSAVAGDLAPAMAFVLASEQPQNIAATIVQLTLVGAATFDDGSTSKSVTSRPDGRIVVPAVRAATGVGTAEVVAQLGTWNAAIELTVVPGPASDLVAIEGGGGAVLPGSTVPLYSVRVVDAFGNAITGAPVQFEVAGDAAFTDTTTVAVVSSQPDGVAASPELVAAAAGQFEVHATSGALALSFGVQAISDGSPAILALSATPVPTISGVVGVGSLLTANGGSWGPPPVTLAYQWYRGGAPIPNATEDQYTPTVDDVGSPLSVVVTGSKDGYLTVTKSSTPTVAVPKLTLSATPRPVISGDPAMGGLLTATSGLWEPVYVELNYQWVRGTDAIPGATASSYRLSSSDVGFAITVDVTGTKAGYQPVTMSSLPTSPVPASTLTSTPTPLISGAARVNQTLSATVGSWRPAPVALAFQWYRGTRSIVGATASSYQVKLADIGSAITVKVTGARPGYASVSKYSAPTAAVPKLGLTATPMPVIKGVTRVGQLLTAIPGDWAPKPVTLSYQWYRGTTAIAGATSARYLLKNADRGFAISVRVTGTKPSYLSVVESSRPTSRVR